MRPARRAAEHGYRAGHFSAAAAAEQVSRARPAYVFAFGSAAEIEDLARQMDRSEFGAFGAAMRTAGAKIQNVALQSVAYGAARVFVEAMKVAGNHPTRASLVAALEQSAPSVLSWCASIPPPGSSWR